MNSTLSRRDLFHATAGLGLAGSDEGLWVAEQKLSGPIAEQ